MSGSVTALAFDYGKRRIGVAIGQTLGLTARPLATVAATDGRPDWKAINGLLLDWQPDELVVGMPVHPDGSPHELMMHVERFARQLHGRYRLPVHCVDETLSSHEANSRRMGSDSATLDAVAAQVILETWWAVRLARG